MGRQIFVNNDNDIVYFDVAAINKGTTVGHGIKVIFSIPEGLDYVASGGNDGVFNPVNNKWLIGNIEPNGIKALNIGLKVLDIDSLPLEVRWEIVSDNLDIDTYDNEAFITIGVAPSSNAVNMVHEIVTGNVFRDGSVYCGTCDRTLVITAHNNITVRIDQDGNYIGTPDDFTLDWDFTWTATCECDPDLVFGGYVVTGYAPLGI